MELRCYQWQNLTSPFTVDGSSVLGLNLKLQDGLSFFYRRFHLKRNPSYSSICTVVLHQHDKTNDLLFSVSLTMRSISPVNNVRQQKSFLLQACVFKILSLVSVLPYSILSLEGPKCFRNRSKQFRREVMFENEHTFCWWIHRVHLHNICAIGVSSGLATKVTITQVS
jgi:hypothetical protein